MSSRSWRDGAVMDDHVTREELAAAVHDQGALVWVDLLNPSKGELRSIAAELGLPATAVEDALAPLERPKLIRHESHLFFTAYATRIDPPAADLTAGRLRWSRVSGIVLPFALVTIRLDDGVDMRGVLARWEENSDLLAEGSGALVHGLLDHVVDGHFEAIQALDEEIETLEDVLFAERSTGQGFVRRVYGVRKDLVALRRLVLPMREVVNGLLRHRQSGSGVLDAEYVDLYDHVLRAAEWTESLRDMVTSLFETNLSLQDARLNIVMRKLAGWAAIIAVPTAVTGWFGQNIPYPGFATVSGLVQSSVLIVVCTLGLYFFLRSRDWI